MARKLAANDRKNLIRLASSLPKGSEERRAILAGLKVAQFRDGDKVFVQLDPYRSPTLWKGEVTLREAKEIDTHLNMLHEMAEEGDGDRVVEIDDEIEALEEEKKRLLQKYGKAISWAKKMKIWRHFERGGETMIPVSFKDPSELEEDWYQIVDGVVEGY